MYWISLGGYPGGYLLVVGEIKVDNEMLVMRLTSRLELIVVRSCSELRSIMGGRVPFRELESTIGTTILGNQLASPLQLQDTRDGQFCSANPWLDLIFVQIDTTPPQIKLI